VRSRFLGEHAPACRRSASRIDSQIAGSSATSPLLRFLFRGGSLSAEASQRLRDVAIYRLMRLRSADAI
jgi:hypothetical protein